MRTIEHMNSSFSCYYREYSRKIGTSRKSTREAFVLEEDFRHIIMPVILEFECRLKHNFINYIKRKGFRDYFWFEEAKFDASFTAVLGNSKSNYEYWIDDSLRKLKLAKCVSFQDLSTLSLFQKKIILRDVPFERICFFSSFGSFVKLLKGIHKNFLEEFCDSYVTTTNSYYKNHSFFKLLTAVKFMRNRCAHSNQILSSHFKNEVDKSLHIDSVHTKYNTFYSNTLTSLVFLLNNVSEKSKITYGKRLIKFFEKHKKFVDAHYVKLYLDKNTSALLKKVLKMY